MNYSVALPVFALVSGLVLASVAPAQVILPTPSARTPMIAVEGEAANPEAVRLLVGLGELRAELQLGLLALQDDHAGETHFLAAREQLLPAIAEGLAAAGAPDLAPLIQALEAGGNDAAVKDAYHAAEEAMLRARASLHPTSEQVMQSVVEMAKSAAGKIDASGTTAVAEYQSAWAVLMVARGELDLLSRDQDRAIAKLAGEKAMAFDDVILFMPDPDQPAPVAFDPALIMDLVAKLEAIGRAA